MKQTKQVSVVNQLCRSCRRSCKQEASVLIASCPRYYQGPKVAKGDWKQIPLPLD